MSARKSRNASETIAEHDDMTNRLVLDSLSPSLLADIFNHLPDAVIVADVERQIVYLNPACEALFGYSTEELLGRKTLILYASEEDFSTQGAKRFNTATESAMEDYRVLYCRADGSPFLGVTTGGAMRDTAGEVCGFIGIIRAARSEERALDALQRLHAITADTALDYDGRLKAILSLGVEYFGLGLAIQSRVSDGEYLVEHCLDSSGELKPGTTFDVSGTYCSYTLRSGRPVGFHYAGRSEIRTHPCYRDFGLEAYIGSPVLVDGEVYGTLNFSSLNPCEPFTRDDLLFSQLLADTVGHNIAQERARKRLVALATTDELTGLSNRRLIIEFLTSWVAQSQRSKLPLTVVALDLDYFKRINDSWGHGSGDAVLVAFARIATRLVREVDLCGRMGGEEFIVVLPDTDAVGGRIVAERLRANLAAEPIQVSPENSINVTLSAGVATLQPGETLENVLARADAALYAAKDAGRDRVFVDDRSAAPD